MASAAGDAAASSPRAAAPSSPEPLVGTWPHALSHEPMLRVSDVLALVQRSFPTLTTSKLRFLDSHGLVCPQRTPSGYRQYSPADVERVRFVLRQQRDHYRPLTVIKEQLDALDSGRLHEPVTLQEIGEAPSDYLSAAEVAERGGVSVDVLGELERAGLVAATVPDGYEPAVLDVVVAASAYLAAGGDVRALRTLVLAARREADRADDAAAPLRRRGGGEADARAADFGEAAIAVFSASVRLRVGG
ncbi:transcriptional regulator FtsR [Demequina lignilytica]|uniref:MerR family transcriptional regulator n=1 Tax=Demequina lignilytica TaxID=3051663 RepID=A0AB35ME26_9MICO|nr:MULTISPECIES: MerR family transcriptional regulator [unclassified Demequina]MDN4481998.1 MerR family transcriptional regulator [Demequina sp. SYSU T0a273]MDN4489343.1 MerR family transcriptional regulator [Demequina sp. SYSU T00068]